MKMKLRDLIAPWPGATLTQFERTFVPCIHVHGRWPTIRDPYRGGSGVTIACSSLRDAVNRLRQFGWPGRIAVERRGRLIGGER